MMKSIEIHRNPLKSIAISFLISIGFYLFPGIAEAATYYVATTGSDSNSGTIAAPFRTIAKGLSILSSGGTLYIRGGNYNERIYPDNGPIPSGNSWADAPRVAAYPGENVIIQGIGLFGNIHYISFENLVLDYVDGSTSGGGGIWIANGAGYIRFKDLEIKDSYQNCVQINNTSLGHNEFIGGNFHDCGGYIPNISSQGDYGFYIGSSNNLFENLQVHDNSGFGFHFYQTGCSNCVNNNIVRNSEIYNNNFSGIIFSSGSGNIAYNNILRNNTWAGISLNYNSVNGSKVYNNTIYGNGNAGIEILGGINSVLKNNIIYNNGGGFLDDQGSGTTQSNNLTSDPKFVNPSSNDFHLQSSSPAINYGVVLSEFTTDKDGNTRVGNYDAGAYEYGGTVPSSLLGDLNNDRIVNSLDWSLMSAKWLTSDTSADLNKDGAVNSLDWSIMSGNWLKTI